MSMMYYCDNMLKYKTYILVVYTVKYHDDGVL